MTENYFYYDPTSDCNTCISQYDYDRLSEKDKQKYQILDGSPNGRVYIDKENLIAENQRLKEQLDREIKINRKMKNALEKYADLKNWRCDTITGFQSVWQGGVDDEQTGNITAQQVLKEIENKE